MSILKGFWDSEKDEPYLIRIMSIIFCLFYASLGLNNIYKPIRLYATGEIREFTIKHKHTSVFINPKLGQKSTYYFANFVEVKDSLRVNEEVFRILNKHKSYNFFYSNKINNGIYLGNKQPSLITCFKLYKFSGLYSIIGILTIVILTVIAIVDLRQVMLEFRENLLKGIDDDLKENRFLFTLTIIKNLVPELIIISAFYAVSLAILKILLIYEGGNSIFFGFVLVLSLILFLYFPYLTFSIKNYFRTSKYITPILYLIKIALGLYTFYKTILFVKEWDENYISWKNLIVDFIKYLFNY